jgi:hypothetical protein
MYETQDFNVSNVFSRKQIATESPKTTIFGKQIYFLKGVHTSLKEELFELWNSTEIPPKPDGYTLTLIALVLLKNLNRNIVRNLSCSYLCTSNTISNKHRQMHPYIIKSPLYVTPTCFSHQRAILRGYNQYTPAAKSTKCFTRCKI